MTKGGGEYMSVLDLQGMKIPGTRNGRCNNKSGLLSCLGVLCCG
jgi:hypothetical protein